VLTAVAALAIAMALVGVRMALDGDFERAPRLIGRFATPQSSDAPGASGMDVRAEWTLAEVEVNNPAEVDRLARRAWADAGAARAHFAGPGPDMSLPAARAIGFVGDEAVLAWLVDAMDRADGLVGPEGVAFRAVRVDGGGVRAAVGVVADASVGWGSTSLERGLVSVRTVDPAAAAPFDPLPWNRAVWERSNATGDAERRVIAAADVPAPYLAQAPWAYRWSCARDMLPEHLRWGGLAALLAFAGTWAYRWRNAASRVSRKAAGAAADLDRFLTAPPEER
jgi:hypothetical protein